MYKRAVSAAAEPACMAHSNSGTASTSTVLAFPADSTAHGVSLLHQNPMCHALQGVLPLPPGRLKKRTQCTLVQAKPGSQVHGGCTSMNSC